LVTDRTLYRPTADAGPLSLVEAAIGGGVQIVQLRVRPDESNDLGLYAVAMHIREMTTNKALFVVTGDVELAEKCHADGVLLPEQSYRPSAARSFLRGAGKYVGVFVQSVVEAARAERGEADYVQVGPVFEDANGLEPEKPDRLALLRKIKDAVHVPVIAFGGVQTDSQVARCLEAGADGIAVTDAVSVAEDPAAAAQTLRVALDYAWRTYRGQ
jgi:thiamine-phosphate diphosphorylase